MHTFVRLVKISLRNEIVSTISAYPGAEIDSIRIFIFKPVALRGLGHFAVETFRRRDISPRGTVWPQNNSTHQSY